MVVTLKEEQEQSWTSSTQVLTFTTTAAILVGEDVFFASGRTASVANLGVTSVTVDAGAGTYELCAVSSRSSTIDVALARFHCTTQIPAGSTFTVTLASSQLKGGCIMQVVAGLTSAAANASSGTAGQGQAGTTSYGQNGTTATTLTASTTGATTVANCLVLAAFGQQGTQTYTFGSGFTLIDSARTVTGSGDRGVLFGFKVVSATAVQTATATIATGAVYAGVIAAFAIDTTPPPPSGPVFKEWNGTTWVTLTSKEWSGTAWTTLDVDEL